MTYRHELVEKFKELHFDAGHYLKSLTPCDQLHGHTYVLRDLELRGTLKGNVLVDFNAVKDLIKAYDHSLLVPDSDNQFWKNLASGPLPYKLDRIVPIEGEPTVERIAVDITRKILAAYPNISRVSFTLFEGINQGVRIEVSR